MSLYFGMHKDFDCISGFYSFEQAFYELSRQTEDRIYSEGTGAMLARLKDSYFRGIHDGH
jgi:hypothetical protein